MRESFSSRAGQGGRKLFLRRGKDGYGFALATHPTALDNGYIHYISEIDPGSPAEYEGLHLGDRVLSIDSAAINTHPHNIVIQLFQRAGKGDRPVILFVTDPTPAIADALSKTKRRSVDALSILPAEPIYPNLCHMVVCSTNPDESDLVMELKEAAFGGHGSEGWTYKAGYLYHDTTNPLAQAPLGPAAKGKIALVLCGVVPMSTQLKHCEAAGAAACVLVNTVVNQPVRQLELEPYEMELCRIPVLNISMRDGVVLIKLSKNEDIRATVFAGRGRIPRILQLQSMPPTPVAGHMSVLSSEKSPEFDNMQRSDGDGYAHEHEPDVNPGMVIRIDNEEEWTTYCGHADFGNYLPHDGITLGLYYPESNGNAEQPFTASEMARIENQAVLIFRGGTSTIIDKVLRCQEAGAAACIVAQNVQGGDAFRVVVSPTGEHEDVFIPTLTLSNEDAEHLRTASLNGQIIEADLYHDMGEDEHYHENENENNTHIPDHTVYNSSADVVQPYSKMLKLSSDSANTITATEWKTLSESESPDLYIPVLDENVQSQLFPNATDANGDGGDRQEASPSPRLPSPFKQPHGLSHSKDSLSVLTTHKDRAKVNLADRLENPVQYSTGALPRLAEDVITGPASIEPTRGETKYTSDGQPYQVPDFGGSDTPPWLHPVMSRDHVRSLLTADTSKDNSGRFLVREIEPIKPYFAPFALSVMYRGKDTHHPMWVSQKVPGAIEIRNFPPLPMPHGSKTLLELVASLRSEAVGTKTEESIAKWGKWPVRLTDAVGLDGSLLPAVDGADPGESGTDDVTANEEPALGTTKSSEQQSLSRNWLHLYKYRSKDDIKEWGLKNLKLEDGITSDDNGKFVFLTRGGTDTVLMLIHKAKITMHAVAFDNESGEGTTVNKKGFGTARDINELVALLSKQELPRGWPTRLSQGLDADTLLFVPI